MESSSIRCRKNKWTISGVAILVFIHVIIAFQIRAGSVILQGGINREITSSGNDEMVMHRMNQRRLPTFENGGLLIFYHIYKTGGSTVRTLMKKGSRDTKSRKKYFTTIKKTVRWKKDCERFLNMAENEKKLIMLELHVEYPAPDFPSLVEMAPTLDRWRLEAHLRNIDFFAFTLIREPKAHALSFFNFFHVGWEKSTQPDSWNPFKRLNATEENFMHAFVGNRQCQMLGSDPVATLTAPSDVVRHAPNASGLSVEQYTCQFDKVYQVLFQSMDWAGTTEKLQNETLPLLSRLILNNSDVGRKVKPRKVFSNDNRGGLFLEDLSAQSLLMLEQETSLDRRLYDEVRHHFTLAGMGLDENFSMYS